MSARSSGDERRRFLRFLAASPLLTAGGIDLATLQRLTSAGTADDGWRLLEEVERATQAPALIRTPDEALSVFDFEPVAKAKLPVAHFGYMASGVDDDATLRANRDGFSRFALRARRLIDVHQVDTSVTIFGQRWETPIFVCPTGSQKMYNREGDVATARAARAQGHLMMLSGVSTSSVEDVNVARGKPVWFQLYPTDVEEVAHAIVRRAGKAGCPALVLTVDLNGGRNLETQRRAALADSRNCADCHLPGVAGGARRKPMFDGLDLSKATAYEEPSMDWAWVKRCHAVAPQMKLVIKGLVTREDAELAVANGVDAIVVSNHGGRAEDSGRSTIESLPEVLRGVRGRIPVLIDGGFRRGSDMVKALALGATAVGIGRPYLWGLASFGQPGVEAVLTIMRRELLLSMRQVGATSLKQLGRQYVIPRVPLTT
ncbi:MAG: alpha-hydroxy acid oxidase [Gemmatimonadaceae bacterium]